MFYKTGKFLLQGFIKLIGIFPLGFHHFNAKWIGWCIENVFKYRTDLVDDKWKDRYDRLWPQILEIPVVKAQIYDKGKQAGTLFNRNLVGSIIGLLKEHEVYSNTNATKMAIALEGTEKHSIRQAIAIPVSKEISDAVQQLLDKQ